MSDSDRDRSSRDRDRSRRDRPSRFSDTSRDRSGDRSDRRDRGGGGDRNGLKTSNCRVYVSNIPYEARWQDLKDLFRDHVGEVQFVELFVDENDKPRGCGIVEFPDSASVTKCLDVMHRFELKGRRIVIKEDFGNARDKHGNLVGKGRRMDRDNNDRDNRRGGGDDRRSNIGSSNMSTFDALSSIMTGASAGDHKWGTTYGLSPQFLESLNISTPLSTRVFVANVSWK